MPQDIDQMNVNVKKSSVQKEEIKVLNPQLKFSDESLADPRIFAFTTQQLYDWLAKQEQTVVTG